MVDWIFWGTDLNLYLKKAKKDLVDVLRYEFNELKIEQEDKLSSEDYEDHELKNGVSMTDIETRLPNVEVKNEPLSSDILAYNKHEPLNYDAMDFKLDEYSLDVQKGSLPRPLNSINLRFDDDPDTNSRSTTQNYNSIFSKRVSSIDSIKEEQEQDQEFEQEKLQEYERKGDKF
ncbi:hypothetical protein WICMUC_004726 [Wickerhamomyces mucosus]|uniref:Uncharacterized protein n=1 Tax=Wickerhamomyces mucosus TaxID=1378264 RepID=A0A9P8TA41_9ASCO|nr:hypothetical protein WICMUC_004726 [Wickerhamomyces mucosus]